jgi:ABC-type transport system involved in Fe-S cluster assembly fused permease/ATPase subunit
VDFDHVSFGYKEDEPVLKDVNLHAEPGQRIALVGETGAGKSTIIRLLARFFDVSAGAVLVDGHDVRAVTQSPACARSWASCCRTPFSSPARWPTTSAMAGWRPATPR